MLHVSLFAGLFWSVEVESEDYNFENENGNKAFEPIPHLFLGLAAQGSISGSGFYPKS